MSIKDSDVAIILAKSARHCCICRQFLPLQIQVHHIDEKHNGGTDHIDNLIPICIMCHAAVHTETAMTRNFSAAELKIHRDTVFEMVAAGKLPASKPLTNVEVSAIASSIINSISASTKYKEHLSRDAVELLLMAAAENVPITFGKIHKLENDGSFSEVENEIVINVGTQSITAKVQAGSNYPHQVSSLIDEALLEVRDGSLVISALGFAHVEKLVSTTNTFTSKKVNCCSCGLHFIICTWHAERHNRGNLTCPECGQNNGEFMVWTQKQLGFIFEQVPGRAMRVE